MLQWLLLLLLLLRLLMLLLHLLLRMLLLHAVMLHCMLVLHENQRLLLRRRLQLLMREGTHTLRLLLHRHLLLLRLLRLLTRSHSRWSHNAQLLHRQRVRRR